MKEQQAQDAFERLVNRHGLAGCKTAHYQSEQGSLRIGVGWNDRGVLAGVFKWHYPELDQEGKSYHYAQFLEFEEGTTEDQAHECLKHCGATLAEKMLSGEVTRTN